MISIKALSKQYDTKGDGPIKAVDGLTLDISEGEIFGIIGYSGAGKSTFVRLLNRLEEPSSGSVTIDREDITKMSSKALRIARQDIGMIFQHFNLLWSRTVEDNIAFPLEIAGYPKAERKKRVQELVRLVGLSGRESAYPSQLSGGQKQRVGIARALANEPKVLLCDEATSALDPETTDAILDLLVDINQKLGLTIILITHEMHVIRKICNQVAVMESGKIVEQGEVLDVFSHPEQNVTKRFVAQVMGEDETESFELLTEDFPEGTLVRLQFVGETANKALISQLAKQFPIDINIVQGKITQTKHGSYGTLVVQLLGETGELEQVVQYIRKETAIGVEVLSHVE
ncbi:methionine ABC transporter ATP-binding protein [Lentibacillus sp. JNUCC-1]|uniref:methionine ABC transporter ATP-binding protein n=1 Tax=Lentibacillus sp. JNUCC-1 TaxID=2654513 RepID=UPI0012E96B62|nr:methionine ABC transporter ATP-binding protein [Lentibacillus sp. JNUCC-1]